MSRGKRFESARRLYKKCCFAGKTRGKAEQPSFDLPQPYCNPSADGLLQAAHDALSGSHQRLASTTGRETASAEEAISRMPDGCCALDRGVLKLLRDVRLAKNWEHVKHPPSA
jgi:hypothetical protein